MSTELRSKIKQADTNLFTFKKHSIEEKTQDCPKESGWKFDFIQFLNENNWTKRAECLQSSNKNNRTRRVECLQSSDRK